MSKIFDAYAAYYNMLYQDKDYKREAKYIASLLGKNDITDGSKLELGSGTGKHAEEFAKMGFSVHGVDLSPEMIREENQRGNNDFANQLYFEIGDVRSFKIDSFAKTLKPYICHFDRSENSL